MKYKFIETHSNTFTVKKMCSTLSVCESSYYHWMGRDTSPRTRSNERLLQRIQELYSEHDKMVGSPMITADLRSEVEFSKVGKNRVAKLMKDAGISCKSVKKFKSTTDSNHDKLIAPNFLNRQFNPFGPNQIWVSDITYIKVGSEWSYLSVFIDLYSRIVVGWDVSDTLQKESVIKAFNNACLRRKPASGLLIHSDRGVQYASKEFRRILKQCGAIQSMSRKGNCWDNAVAESFFHTLKTQYTHHKKFKNEQELRFGLFKYIELYYNRRRRHSANQWRTPVEMENIFFSTENWFNCDWMKMG